MGVWVSDAARPGCLDFLVVGFVPGNPCAFGCCVSGVSRWVARDLADDAVDGLLDIWWGLGNSFSSVASRLYWGSCFGCAGSRFYDIFVSLDGRWL